MNKIICLLIAGMLFASTPPDGYTQQKSRPQSKTITKQKKTATPKTSTKAKTPKPSKIAQQKAASTTGAAAKSLPNVPVPDTTKPKNLPADEIVGKTESGKPVYEGSRGGHYYINSSGKKSYVEDFVGAKIVGKTKDGQNIFEGPHGGHFYYNAGGSKVYVRR